MQKIALLKGVVHPKMTNLLLITHPHVVQNTNEDIYD